MSLSRAVVWTDHQHAVVIAFDADDATTQRLHAPMPTARHGSAMRSEHAFLADLCTALEGAAQVLVTGERTALADLRHHVSRHRPQLAARILAYEIVDHPSDRQLLAHARWFFDRADGGMLPTVRADPGTAAYRRILVAVDGSETAAAGLDEAIRVARLSGGSLHLVHVVDVLQHASGFETGAAYADQVLPRMRAAGQAVLRAAADCAAAHGVAADCSLVEARDRGTAGSILQAAQAAGADLIVLGTHGRRGLARAFAGSDAEQVVRQAHVPVLLVRQPAVPGRRAEAATPDARGTAAQR